MDRRNRITESKRNPVLTMITGNRSVVRFGKNVIIQTTDVSRTMSGLKEIHEKDIIK